MTEVIEDANYVAIAIPWLNNCGIPNANIIEEEHINSLRVNAKIVSASAPGIFSPQALNLMNNLVQQQQLFVRIDTAKRRADEAREKYIYIDIAHNQAFAAPECQQVLDQAMLTKAKAFIKPCQC